MKAAVSKWGNSLGIRIPVELAAQIGIEDKSEVELSIEGHQLVVERRLSSGEELARLMVGITPDQYYGEVDWGQDVGAEGLEAWTGPKPDESATNGA